MERCACCSEVVYARSHCCSRNSRWTTWTPCLRRHCRCPGCLYAFLLKICGIFALVQSVCESVELVVSPGIHISLTLTPVIFANVRCVRGVDSSTVWSPLPLGVGGRSRRDITVASSLQSAQLAEDSVQIDILGIWKRFKAN